MAHAVDRPLASAFTTATSTAGLSYRGCAGIGNAWPRAATTKPSASTPSHRHLRPECPASFRFVQAIPYTVFDPSACAFPPPRVPLLPTLTRGALGRSSAANFTLVGMGRPRCTYTRGRYALFDAYRLSGVGPEGGLLVPAYHCRTMLDPAISLGAPVLLYSLDERLAPDVTALQQLVQRAVRPARALLLTHYFGFAQEVVPIKAFCEEHSIALIEDCSHALFNLRGAERLGKHGRYTTASPYKLFPCEEGGLLIPGPGAPMPAQRSRSVGPLAEFKALGRALERSWIHRNTRRGSADIDRLDSEIRRIAEAPIERGSQTRSDLSGTSQMYIECEQGLAGSAVARWLMSLCDIDRLAARRRNNYKVWSDAVRGLPHCRPLFDRLPDDCVPYMFPLVIDHSKTHFYVLKKLGVPIWRWDEMAVSGCEVSQRYREHLLHLPCHQSLSDVELAWMASAVAKVLREVPVSY